MVDVYLCKDCKHSCMSIADKIFTLGGIVGVTDLSYRCSKFREPAKQVINVVTGPEKIKEKLPFCELTRQDDRKCGPQAKYWVPKHKKDLFKMLTKEHND